MCLVRSRGTFCSKRSTSIEDAGKQHLFETNHMWPEESIEGESGHGWEAGRRHCASQSPPSLESFDAVLICTCLHLCEVESVKGWSGD